MRLTKSLVYVLIAILFSSLYACSGDQTSVESPDGKITATVDLQKTGSFPGENQLVYSVKVNGREIISASSLGIDFKDMPPLGRNIILESSSTKVFDESWERVWGRSKVVRNHYSELLLSFKETGELKRNLEIIVRAYDDGIAFRYNIPEQPGLENFSITAENTTFNFKYNPTVWAAEYGFVSHQEAFFNEMKIADIDDKIMGLPIIVKLDDHLWASVTEANLTDWAGMFLSSSSDSSLISRLAPGVDDPEVAVKSGTVRHTPWRVIMLGNSAGSFLESDIIQNLNDPNAIDDVSWIKPGKSAWDWWWCNKYAPDAGFELGSNQETMKYFIDFAAEMNWDYQLVDWYWYGPPFELKRRADSSRISNPDSDIKTENPNINIPGLVEYAGQKGVKLLLWLEWNHADKQMEEAFPLYEKWGVAGVKVDFMQREDQYMVNFYHRVVKLAAKHHLVVDFHGAYKPTGFSRTYPNMLTREGVMGNEYTKWSENITPEHTTTIAFTRNMLGEMDFTPGAFVNVTRENFKNPIAGETPMVMSTRANQLAMMVVFESALQVLCDSPFNYRNSPAGLNFLKEVPTTWDETKFLAGEIGNYISVARRAGDTWYVGTMTDSNERNLEISLDFLDEGSYSAHVWKDAEDASINPANIMEEKIDVDKSSVIRASLAVGGGHVMVIMRKEK